MSPGVKIAYGLDLDGDQIVGVIRTTRRGRQFRHEVIVAAPPEGGAPAPSAAFPESLIQEVESGRAVAAGAMPAAQSFTRWLKTPFPSLAKAKKVFPSLLDIQLPFPLESCAYQFLEARSTSGPPIGSAGAKADPGASGRSPAGAGGTGHVQALAVAARVEHITRRLEEFSSLGIDPDRLDHEGLALWTQAMDEMPVESDTFRVVGYLGRHHATLVLGQGRKFLGAHSTHTGTVQLFPEGTAPGAAGREAFIRRIQQILYAHRAEMGDGNLQWIWTGPGAENADWRTCLQKELSPVSAQFLSISEPRFFLARALGTRALREDSLPCNFRSEQFTHPRARRAVQRERTRRSLLALATGALLCLLNLAWHLLLVHRDTALQDRLSRLAAELAQLSRVPRGQEVMVVNQALEQRAPLTEPFLQAFQPSPSVWLARITDTAGRHKVFLETLTLRRDFLSVQGRGADWNQCQSFANDLGRFGFAIRFEPQDAGPDELVHFTVQGKPLS